MTRGNLIIKNGKVYTDWTIFWSDAYPDGEIGKMFIKAFEAKDDLETEKIIKAMINEQNDYLNEQNDYVPDPKNLTESLYNKAKSKDEDAFYYDYSYVYDVKRKELKIYHFGELSYQFKKKDIGYLNILVFHKNKMYSGLSYDFDKKIFGDKEAKNFKKLIKEGKTPEEILDIINENLNNIHYSISWGKMADCYRNAYGKTVQFYPNGGQELINRENQLLFIINKEDYGSKPWEILIQLPYCRYTIVPNLSSEGSAKKALIKYLEEKWESLQNGIPLYGLWKNKFADLQKLYNESKENPNIDADAFSDKANIIKEELSKELKQYEGKDFSAFKGMLNPKKMIDEIDFKSFYMYQNLCRKNNK